MEEIKAIDSISCKEIYIILNKLDLFNKLPSELREYIKENQSLSHEFDFNKDLPLIYQIENEKTKEYLTYLYIKYINDSEEEKELLINQLEKNEEEHLEKLEKYANSDIEFENVSTEKSEEIVERKVSLIDKIINFIKGIFRKNS